MTILRSLRLPVLLVLMTASSALLAQGLYYESVLNAGMPGKDAMASKTYLMPKMMKHVSPESGDFMIVRLDQEKMIGVDAKAKTYWEMTFTEMEQTMKASSAKMDAQMAQLQEQLKKMPEEQRKMMEQRMGSMMSPSDAPVTLTATGEKKQISGFPCTKYVAKQGEKTLMTLWATKDVKAFEGIRKDYQALSRRLTAMNPRFAKGITDAMTQIEGFPVETDFGPMTNVVTKVESRATAASEFAVPAGFTKVDPPLKKAMSKEDK